MSFAVGSMRFSKQVSRERIADVCRHHVDLWGAENTCYISLAGPQFADSYVMHDKLGIPFDNMASAEKSNEDGPLKYQNNQKWARFAKPTRKFQLRATQPNDKFPYDIQITPYAGKHKIIWYDSCSVSETVLEDVKYILSNWIRIGSLLFLTFIETPRRSTDATMSRVDKELPNYSSSDSRDVAVYQRFVEKIADKAKEFGFGVKVNMALTYESSKADRVFVVGFEAMKDLGLDNSIQLETLPARDRATNDIELTEVEIKRLALIFKCLKCNKLLPQSVHEQIGIPKEAFVSVSDAIRRMATVLNEDEVRKEFPTDFSNLIPNDSGTATEPSIPTEETKKDVRSIEDLCGTITSELDSIPKEDAIRTARKIGGEMYSYASSREEDPLKIVSRMSLWKKFFDELKAVTAELGDGITDESLRSIIEEFNDEFIADIHEFTQKCIDIKTERDAKALGITVQINVAPLKAEQIHDIIASDIKNWHETTKLTKKSMSVYTSYVRKCLMKNNATLATITDDQIEKFLNAMPAKNRTNGRCAFKNALLSVDRIYRKESI